MDGLGLYQELQSKASMLDVAVRELRARGTAYSQAERDYRVALRKAVLEERTKGTPVTIISDVCRGREDIAQLRFERDCAETLYKSAQEALQVFKLQCRLIEAQIQREYGQGGSL